jgi:hypothetical protein
MRHDQNIHGSRHIVGVFETEQAAISAIEDLKSLGYAPDDISVISRRRGDADFIEEATQTKAPEGVATGATAGGVLGGVTGLLAGLGALAIPGIGPLLAAGPIAATLAGAAIGASAGGIVGGLIGMGIPEEQAQLYNDYVEDNKFLVIVESDPAKSQRVFDIFRSYGSLNSDSYTGVNESRSNLVDESAYEAMEYGGADTDTVEAARRDRRDLERPGPRL